MIVNYRAGAVAKRVVDLRNCDVIVVVTISKAGTA